MAGGIVYLEQEIEGVQRSFAFWSDDGTLAGNLTQLRTRGPQSSPLAGAASASGVLGPFVPGLDSPINLTLSGTWAGTVRLLRSTDAGATKIPVTLAGGTWGEFTSNVNEPVWEEGEAGVTFYLQFERISGTLNYRMAQ